MAFRGLFIGLDRVASPRFGWLTSARRDALALHSLFSDSLGPGGELLTDGQATRGAIERSFQALATCQPDDVAVVTFSGHGSTTHELVTYDADPDDLTATAIPLATLADWFSRIPARLLVFVLDCCFSGGFGAKVFVSDATARAADSTDELLEQMSGSGRIVLTAATANQEAWEVQRYRHGLLTYHLIQALQGPEEIVEGGKIPIYRLLEYVSRKVISDAAVIGKRQEPTLRGQLDGNVTWPVFVPGANYRAAFPGRCLLPATADIASLGSYGFPAELLKAWAGSIPSLNPLQLAAINDFGLLNGEHLVVSAPTSSGKTMVGELAALRGVLDRKRACFLFPLKALVNDKHRHFTKVYGEFGVRVIRATGEMSDDIPALMRGQYDICLLTYEKFASLVVGAPHLAEQLGTVVVDEVQMLADETRGANLEFLLTILRMKRRSGVEPQLIALSAVIGDANGLEDWLGGRLLRRHDRPVPLDEGLLLSSGRFRYIDDAGEEHNIGPILAQEFRKNSSQDWIVPLVRRLVTENKQVLVFRETTGEARGCAKYLAQALGLPPAQAALDALSGADPSLASGDLRETLRHGVAFHTSHLDRDERLVIEEQFRAPDSKVRVIAATTTLAMGVNTPAEAVVIAGLMHPGDNPYSVAEYKNIVGRAGRRGFCDRGTAYLLALDFREEFDFWNKYVKGIPEDLNSRFLAEGTDPRTLILRVLSAARSSKVKGIPSDDVIDFLEGSFGAFQERARQGKWSWNRLEISRAFSELVQHRLIAAGEAGHYHLTALGRFVGEAGVQVESIIRLVAALTPLAPSEITDPVLVTATQLTIELDEQRFPINKKSTHKEPQTWHGELSRQGIPSSLLGSLQHYVQDQHTGTLRAKKATASLFWISRTPMTEIEAAMTQHGGSFDGASGAVRATATRTADLLPAVARTASFLHPSLDLGDRVARLLVRLELGVPAPTVPLARHAGAQLSRGDYQQLLNAGFHTPEGIEAASDERLLACLSGDVAKVAMVREARVAMTAERPREPAPALPQYED